MTKITMNRTTSFQGKTYETGKTYEIEEQIALRWNNKGISSIVVEPKKVTPKPEPKEEPKKEPTKPVKLISKPKEFDYRTYETEGEN